MATFKVRTNIPYAVIMYGNKSGTFTKTADVSGAARFEWSDLAVYVNAQKTDCFFSDKILLRLPINRSWGMTSDWFLVTRLKPVKHLYGLRKLDVPIEALLEEAEAAKRLLETEAIKAEEAIKLERGAAEERARLLKEAIRTAVDPDILGIIYDDYYLRKLYETDPSAAISEARDKLAAIEAREFMEADKEVAFDKAVVRLLIFDCFKNKWKHAFGKYWACCGKSAQQADICMSDLPIARCPGGEERSVKKSKIVAFSSGHKVRYSRIGGAGKTGYAEVEITCPAPAEAISEVIEEVEEIPAVVAKLSKTLKITRLASSVFKGDSATIIGSVAVDGRFADNEPVVLYVDSRKAAETVTKYGIFSFEYEFAQAGSRKLTLESPATDRYPDVGRDVRTVLVSSVPLELEERLRIEREEYAARREALKRKRIIVPDEEYRYEPIFKRNELVTSEPEFPPIESEPSIPTRGSISVDLPIPPIPGQLIEVPVAVWLDGKFKGNAPTTISNIKAGVHTIVLKMAGFSSPPIDVDVRENEVSSISGIEMIPM